MAGERVKTYISLRNVLIIFDFYKLKKDIFFLGVFSLSWTWEYGYQFGIIFLTIEMFKNNYVNIINRVIAQSRPFLSTFDNYLRKTVIATTH